jgi:UDP-3-O-[3-hydroxymyristoyl] N-acetylglucosamine deacetylase
MVVGDRRGPLASGVEHVLAALNGLGVDNVILEIDGPEIPIMDGSAIPFVEAIDKAGIKKLKKPKRYIEVLKELRVVKDNAIATLQPYSKGFHVEVEIAFPNPQIGRQSCALDITSETFRRELASARTFGFLRDVEKLWSAGYAMGASFENSLVFADDRLLNPEGLRVPDECVRHKALDAVGDWAMAGAPILGAYRSQRGGHRLNYAMLRSLMEDRSAWRMTDKPRALAPV